MLDIMIRTTAGIHVLVVQVRAVPYMEDACSCHTSQLEMLKVCSKHWQQNDQNTPCFPANGR